MEAKASNLMETQTPNPTTNNYNHDDKVEYDLKNNRDTTTSNTGDASKNNYYVDKEKFWHFNPSLFDLLNHVKIKDENQVPNQSKLPDEDAMGMVFIFCIIFGIFIGLCSSSKLITLILLLSTFIVMTIIKPEVTDKIVSSILNGVCTVYLMLRFKTSSNRTYVHDNKMTT